MLSKKEFEDFRKDVKEALVGVEEKYGISLSLGKITYTDIQFSTKINATVLAKGKSKDQMVFEKYCDFYGLKPGDFGKTFSLNAKTFKLLSINPKAKKYPIIGVDKQGAKYKFDLDAVKNNIL